MNQNDQEKHMKTTTVKLHPTVQELSFIISPPRHIASDVSVLKDDIHYLIGRTFDEQRQKAHVPLFRYKDAHMEDMIAFAEDKVKTFAPCNIFLKDFGVAITGTTRTIYLDIVNKTPVEEMFEKLVKAESGFVPHIPLARNLQMEDFLRCWPYLKSLHYGNQHFLCDRITVLARMEKKWIHYKDLLFGEDE